MPGYSMSRICIAVVKDRDLKKKKIWKGKGLFHPEVWAGTQGRDLEAGTDVEAMEEHCLLACSLFLLRYARTTCPG